MPDNIKPDVQPEKPVPVDLIWTEQARNDHDESAPKKDFLLLVTGRRVIVTAGEQPYMAYQVSAHQPFFSTEIIFDSGKEPKTLPEGSLVHVCTTHLSNHQSSKDIMLVTPPKAAVITRKLPRNCWLAKNTHDGSEFAFSEASDRFVGVLGVWPKVGAEITYHQTPMEVFAVIAKPKLDMAVFVSGSGTSYLPHGSAIPNAQQIEEIGLNKRGQTKREGGLGAAAQLLLLPLTMAALKGAEAVYNVRRSFGLNSHRMDPSTGFYVPEGYGRRPTGP